MKRVIVASTDWKAKEGIKDAGNGVGFSEDQQKWWGWSHRARYGFGIGHVCKKGDCGVSEDGPIKPGFKCKTLDDCKKVAENFAESVS